MSGHSQTVALAPLAWATALTPLVTLHVCYWLSASEQVVPWCLPWLEGCTSISGASREGIAYFVFKGVMLPATVLIASFWVCNRYWVTQQGGRSGVWWVLGVLSAPALALYAVILGHWDEGLPLLRRIAVIIFFSLTYFAQLGLGAALMQSGNPLLGQRLVALSAFTLFVGLVSVFIGLVWPVRHEAMEAGFEWTLAVLVNLHSLMVAHGWHRSRFCLRFGGSEQ